MGSLYLLVAYEAGVDGTLFSMLVRTELALPFVSVGRLNRSAPATGRLILPVYATPTRNIDE